MGSRCFVAIPLPQAYQEMIPRIASTWKHRLRSRLTWTKAGNWHLTLSFLGDLPEDRVAEVQQALLAVSMPPLTLQAGGGGFFPPGKTPRVLWVGLRQGAEECTTLAKKVESVLVPLGFAPDSRPFRAHLTLARIKQSRADDWGAVLKALQALSWPSISITKFVLYASQLSPQGPVYTALQTYTLS